MPQVYAMSSPCRATEPMQQILPGQGLVILLVVFVGKGGCFAHRVSRFRRCRIDGGHSATVGVQLTTTLGYLVPGKGGCHSLL